MSDMLTAFSLIFLVSSLATWMYLVIMCIEVDNIRTIENYRPRHDIDPLLWVLRILGLPVMLLIAMLGLTLEFISKLFGRLGI